MMSDYAKRQVEKIVKESGVTPEELYDIVWLETCYPFHINSTRLFLRQLREAMAKRAKK